MKAAVLKDKGLMSIEEVPIPKAGPGEAVVRVSYCGICGTDLRFFSGDFEYVQKDIEAVVAEAKEHDVIVKVILETCWLSPEQARLLAWS